MVAQLEIFVTRLLTYRDIEALEIDAETNLRMQYFALVVSISHPRSHIHLSGLEESAVRIECHADDKQRIEYYRDRFNLTEYNARIEVREGCASSMFAFEPISSSQSNDFTEEMMMTAIVGEYCRICPCCTRFVTFEEDYQYLLFTDDKSVSAQLEDIESKLRSLHRFSI